MRNVALIDLDRTLINEQYQLTDEGVIEEIRNKQKKGWQIGLTSDTPMLTLYQWWKKLGMNGPIVFEKGAAVWYPEDDAIICLTKAGNLVKRAKPILLGRFYQMDRHMLVYGDSTNFIRVVRAIPESINNVLIAFNGLREYSLSLHVRRIQEETGELVIDVDLTEAVIERIRDFLPISELLAEGVIDPDYGFFYINPSDVNKTIGAAEVQRSYRPDRLVLIGDSMSDFPEDLPGAEAYAVGNATKAFKEKAHKIATGEYASGVKELLNQA